MATLREFERTSRLPDEERERRRMLAYPDRAEYEADKRRIRFREQEIERKKQQKEDIKLGIEKRKAFIKQLEDEWAAKKAVEEKTSSIILQEEN